MKPRVSTKDHLQATTNNQEQDAIDDLTAGLHHIAVHDSKSPVVSFGDAIGKVAKISTARELRQQLPDICNEVFTVLGLFQLEATYQRALAIELKARGVHVESEVSLSVVYKELPIATRRLDLLLKLDKAVVLELKAVTTALKSDHIKQLHFYMTHFDASEGFLINFPHKTGFPDSDVNYRQQVLQPEHGPEVSDRVTRASTPKKKSELPHIIFVQRVKSTKTVKKTTTKAEFFGKRHMSALFPAPVRAYTTFSDTSAAPAAASAPSLPAAQVPKYPHRVKQQFVPRRNEDFGDGGAYPELHVAQFPLGMGKKKDGGVNYDAIVTQQHRDKTKVYTKFSDIVEKDGEAAALALPSRDEEMETTNRTKQALQKLVQGKVASSLPVNVSRQKTVKETAKYIRYTPNEQVEGAPKQRIIRMVDVQKDPMEPPKFQHTKAVRGPPSPPVPVLHSPPRKLTVTDQQSWKIPPCISNWKNSKGFTIALDKRLAADGRGLQQVTVNDNFASLSEALAIAERKAREEVNMRAQVQKKLAMKQKEQKENELREMASKARMERAGIRADDEEEDPSRSRRRRSSSAHSDRRSHSSDGSEDSDAEGRRERDRIRRDRKKEHEREMRMEKLGKKGKLARDQDRDISEKIALGQLQGGGKAGGSDAMFDSRLFNQSQGISSGFGQEDEYNVYSKPMVDRGKASVYRPKGDDGAIDADKEYEELKGGHTKRFKADKQFRGTEAVARSGARDGPVQFSYDTAKDEDDEDADKKRTAAVDRRKSASRSPPPSKDRARSPADSPPRSRGRDRSPSASPSRARGRGRSPSDSPPRSRGRGRSPSKSPPRSRGRGRSSSRSRSPIRGRDRSAPRGRKRSPSRSPSYSRERGRPRARSRSPAYSRRRSPSYSRSRRDTRRRSPSRSRSRSADNHRKRRRRSPSESSDDDPFGLDQFLTDARKGADDDRRSPRRRR